MLREIRPDPAYAYHEITLDFGPTMSQEPPSLAPLEKLRRLLDILLEELPAEPREPRYVLDPPENRNRPW